MIVRPAESGCRTGTAITSAQRQRWESRSADEFPPGSGPFSMRLCKPVADIQQADAGSEFVGSSGELSHRREVAGVASALVRSGVSFATVVPEPRSNCHSELIREQSGLRPISELETLLYMVLYSINAGSDGPVVSCAGFHQR